MSSHNKVDIGEKPQLITSAEDELQQRHADSVIRTFTCPITTEIMNDPVICPEGHTFERSAIVTWLRKNSTNPVTRNPLSLEMLVSNRALKDSITLYREREAKANFAAAKATGCDLNAGAKQTSSTGLPTVNIQVFNEGSITFPGSVPVAANKVRKLVQVQVAPEDIARSSRTPCDVICVVDVSGSMCSAAKSQDANGNSEDSGLNVLDITKHAVVTVMAVLGENDRFSLVSYSNSARVECGLTYMNATGRAHAKSKLETLKPCGSTNLWDGLKKGFDTLRDAADEEAIRNTRNRRHQTILLLTDGNPTIIPPRGHLPTMERYLKRYPLNCTVHTFGFGYNLDSTLLAQLATLGRGQYAFIPDAGMVGTVFVNALSNILSTMAKNVNVKLQLKGDAEVVEDGLWSFQPAQKTSTGVELSVGALNYGQTRTLALHVDVPADCSKSSSVSGIVQMEFVKSGRSAVSRPRVVALELPTTQLGASDPDVPSTEANINPVLCRAAMNRALVEALNSFSKGASIEDTLRHICDAANYVKACAAIVHPCNASTDKEDVKMVKTCKEHMIAIVKDLENECMMAFKNSKATQKWGRHYIPSLCFAHCTERCNNFKDPGVQYYGGAMFEAVRDTADEIFLELPPPTPSRIQQLKRAGGHVPSLNMKNYYNCSGGCIAGHCEAVLANGEMKRVNRLKMGDLVRTSLIDETAVARVRCVVKTFITDSNKGVEMKVFNNGKLSITPYHPIRELERESTNTLGHWKFPIDADAKHTELILCPAMYTFVLEQKEKGGNAPGLGLIVGGFECAALGHGVDNNDVLSHEFLGTHRVIEALQKCQGWSRGYVRLNQKDFKRNPESNRMCDIIQSSPIDVRK